MVDEDRIEAIVDRTVEERLAELDPSGDGRSGGISRRQALGALATGAIGGGLAGVGATEGTERLGLRESSLSVDQFSAGRVDVDDQLRIRGEPVSPGATAVPGANPDTIFAETAADVQPAIDELAEDVDDAGARGGVVQLAAKTYYPETTIWLKGGVTLQGVRRSRPTNPHRTNDPEQQTRSTVLSTAEMGEGANAYTYEHDPEVPHPHFPVVANFLAPPVEDGSARSREPTDYEQRHWGHDVALRNVIIRADKQRWWRWDDHGAGDVYDTETAATYFGVYDATLFEQSKNLLTENVVTRGFLGYGGFFKDTRNVIDRGSFWSGGATDHHGAAFKTFQDGTYVNGIWDFQVRGPRPAAVFAGHIDNKFVSSGGVPQNSIVGEEPVFLGDESAYLDGEAPRTNPEYVDSILVEQDQRTHMDGYTIAPAGNDRVGIGLHVDNANCRFSNVTVSGADTAFLCDGGVKTHLTECKAHDSNVGIRSVNAQPDVGGFYLEDVNVGFSFLDRARPTGSFDSVTFQRNCQTVFGDPCQRPVTFNHPCFYGVTAIGEEFETLVINDPAGYEDAA